MPPRGSQKPGPKSSQQSSGLTNAFKKLCDHLKKARKTSGEIGAPDAVNILKESLRTHRTKATHIEPKFVIDLVPSLEKEGTSICTRLDEVTFSVIVETILQSDYSVESERGLFLLSDSLHNYRGPTVNGKSVEKRKDLVGKKCFELLLTYFIETSHPSNIRRRVGFLCIELLQGSDENVQRLEQMPDALRRGIGEALIKEDNEVVRSICGRLVRTIEAAGLPVDSLWPIKHDAQLYDGLPSTKRRHLSWSQQYTDYVDKLVQKANPESHNQLYLHYAKGCELTPSHRFGDPNAKVNIYLNDGHLTILAPSSGSNVDQLLDVPWIALFQMTIIFQTESQVDGTADVIIEVRNDDRVFCVLDGEGIKLESVFFSSDIEQIQSLKEELLHYCREMQIIEEYDMKQGTDEHKEPSQHSFTTAAAVRADDEVVGKTTMSQNVSEEVGDLNASIGYQNLKDDLYGASPRKNTQRAENDVQEAEAGPRSPKETNQSKIPAKKRKGVKPVAKPPIRLSQIKHDERDNAEGKAKTAKPLTLPGKAIAQIDRTGVRQSKVAASTAEEIEEFEVGKLTSPDLNDASTPKITKKGDMDTKDYIQLKGAQKRNGHSLNVGGKPKSAASNSTQTRDVFELPDDEEDDDKSHSVSVNGKPSQKTSSKAQPKKPAVQKTVGKKREPKISTIEAMPPPKARPVKKRQSAPSIVESMPPPKRVPDNKKRQSAPPAPVIQTKPSPPKRVTRGSKGAMSCETTNAESASVTLPLGGQDAATELIVEEPIDKPPVLEKEVVKDTPVKSNGKPKPAQKATNDPVAPKSAANPLIKMASKLGDLLDFAATRDGEDNGSGDETSPQPISQSKEHVVANDEQLDEDELAGLSNNTLTEPTKVAVGAKVDAVVFKVPDRPKRLTETLALEDRETIEGQTTRKLDATPVTRNSTSPAAQSEGSNESRKRKAATGDTTPSKRSRQSDKETRAVETPTPRRSPRIAAKLKQRSKGVVTESSPALGRTVKEKKERNREHLSMAPPDQVDPRGNNDRLKMPAITTIARGLSPGQKSIESRRPLSPKTDRRAEAKAPNAATLGITGSKTPLVDDRLARKPAVISFDRTGARNQGVSNTPKPFAEPMLPKGIPSKEGSIQKRKSDEADIVRPPNPKKRKSMSPPAVHVESFEDCEQGEIHIGSSPPELHVNNAKLSIGNRLLQTRHSSQGSRVDANGSPRPSPMGNVDHIKRLEKSLAEETQVLEEGADEETVQNRPRRLSGVFGPKVKLSSQSKEAPTSLEKSSPRYMVVKKNKNGHYEEVKSKELILPQKVLPDPFIETNSGVSSGFAERLQLRGKSRGADQNDQQHNAGRELRVDPEKDLVNVKSRARTRERLPSLSTGTSVDSRSSEPSRSPLREVDPAEIWNAAVRPHYATLQQAVHRIADEVIIRLAEEEDKMDLLVDEYKENGAKILDGITQKRAREKSKMTNSLEEKKGFMLKAYTATRKSISSTIERLKQQPTGLLARSWRTEQEFIREKMGQGSSVDAA